MSNITIGFIILRHVNNDLTSKYYLKCYECIRKFFPDNEIVIIDDNSNYDFINQVEDNNLYKTKIINSEYKKRGELLPYFYYLKHNFFDIAIIIHDSVFIKSKINTNINKYKFLWEFDHPCDTVSDEIQLLNYLNNKEELIYFYYKKILWKGCFGGMSVIRYDFLKYIDDKYNIKNLIHHIDSRRYRMAFERVIACVFQYEKLEKSLFRLIHEFCPWGIKYDEEYINNSKLPIVKIWTGR
jgi:hypothetical protein